MAFRRGLVSIFIFEADHLSPIDRESHLLLRPDGLYPAPYPLRYGTSIEPNGNTKKYALPNFASGIARKFSIRLEDHAFDSGKAMITVRLTPSLADGEIQHLARQVHKTGCIENEVAIGLSSSRFKQSTLLDRRAALVSAIARSTRMIADREGWRSDLVEIVESEFTGEQRDLADFNEDPRSLITIPGRMFELLHLNTWNSLTPQEQRTITNAVTEALTAHSRKMQFVGIGNFGPPSDEHPVALWIDTETGLRFSLVPGGKFRPGYNPQLLNQYEKLYERLYSMILNDVQDADEAESLRCRPDSLQVYGSMGTCDITSKNPTVISPFLISCDPITCGLNSAHQLVASNRIRVYSDSPDQWRPLYLEWGEVGPVLRRFGWTLPSSAEMEWAIGAGQQTLFYWGNEPHKAILAFHSEEEISEEEGEEAFDQLLHGSFEPDRPRVWPWVNRFGLAGVLTQNVWCSPDLDPGNPYPLIHRGGATSCFPWQYCGEWELLLTASESRTTLDGKMGVGPSATIRPAIRLVRDD